jgi:hypothetical protein
MTVTSKVVAIVQPYVPEYRVPFFEELNAGLAKHSVNLQVIAGIPEKAQALRGDSKTPNWLIASKNRNFAILGKTFVFGSNRALYKDADLVVFPLMGTLLEGSLAALTRKRVAYWGHVGNYTKESNFLDLLIERWMMRRAAHVFAYTSSGRAAALRAGVKTTKVTAVMNTIDTRPLVEALDEVPERDLATPNALEFVFIGGLDKPKRIKFLVESLDLLASRGVDFHVTVIGRGEEAKLFESLVHGRLATLVGYDQGLEKARALKGADAILSPGRIGLLAIDALVSGVPVLTTNWLFHAPEREYLVEGESQFTSEDSTVAFADLIESQSYKLRRSNAPWVYPKLDDMVSNFSRGILEALENEVHE